MQYRSILAISFLIVAACAVTDRTPIVLREGVDEVQYSADRDDCQRYAEQVDVERELVLNAVIGAIALGAVGAFLGSSEITEHAIAIGVVTGTSQGAQTAIAERNDVLGNCMSAKGYTVLN